MKVKHLVMAIATLLLPACTNNNTKNNTQRTGITVEGPSPVELPVPVPTDLNTDLNTINNENKSIENSKETNEVPPTIETPEEMVVSYSTKIYTKTNARMNNLKIVAGKIDNYIIKPNEVFSYNEICGPYDKAHGFKKATIFVKNKDVQGYGGGVCQVSSTLYNAVKDAGVEILERHNHSKEVYYVPKNQDATVSYGNLDFKFKNLNDYSLKIKASVDKKNVTISIYKV